MPKLNLNTITSRYASVAALNSNFDAIETAIDNTLSRDGTSPNPMSANIDMDSNKVVNVADATNNADAVNLRQLNATVEAAGTGLISSLIEYATATASQTVFTLVGLSYTPGANNLKVYVNGVLVEKAVDYTETSSTVVTFLSGLAVNSRVTFISNTSTTSSVQNAAGVVYNPAGTGAVATNVQTKLRESVSVKDFGAVGDGVTDDTAAIMAAYASVSGVGTNKNRALYFPAGYYSVSILDFLNVQEFTFIFDSAVLLANSVVAQDAVLKITNAFNVQILGSVIIDCADRANYAAGFRLRGLADAGAVDPSGLVARMFIDNMSVASAKVGHWIGDYNTSINTAGIVFNNARFFDVPACSWVGGAETFVSYSSSLITSEPNVAFVGADEYIVKSEGAVVSITGGETTLASTQTERGFWMNPSSVGTKPYGQFKIANAHIECASPQLVIENPRSIVAPTSSSSSYSCIGCAGYSSLIDSDDFIQIVDTTYAGYVHIQSCNFYAPVARTGYNISSASDLAHISVDRGSFNVNFLNWIGGVSGGILQHYGVPAMFATGLGVSIGGAGAVVVKFLNPITTNEFGRYGGNYSAATGLFTVPAGGLTSLEVSASIIGGSATTGDIFIQKNSTIMFFGLYLGTTGSVNGTLYDLAEGDTVGVYINGAGSVAFNSSVFQALQMSASND